MSQGTELIEGLPEQTVPEAAGRGAPRFRRPERRQAGWHVAAIDDLVAPDHPVRAVWGFAAAMDLRELHEAVKAREGVPGQAPPAPELMMALWLWATADGVGSARQLDRLCEQHLAYRWLCGGVSMNYHTLSDFRVAHGDVLERLLARGLAAMVAEGLVALDVLAQDGVKVRAAAGAGSFRRRARLEKLEAAATERVAQLRAEIDTDPGAGERRQRAAQQRAARDHEERVRAALERMKELEAERARREKTNKTEVKKQKEPRASTTDPEARVMKMADGGFRPAYNMQIVSVPASQVIVAVDIETSGSDRGLARPALENLGTGGTKPSDYLVDGGFTKNEDIEWAHASDIKLWCPPTKNKHGTEPYAPRRADGPGIADWRQRMASEAGKTMYRERSKAECVNAWGRRMGLGRLLVRGKRKAGAVLLWFALAYNMLRAFALRRAAAEAAA
ncbi:MAG TPA: IS1182 family transposase [Xanthobacteraceae bacterium]|nr:IS1182 family transposase [Xanthobacteraceae bacterium]